MISREWIGGGLDGNGAGLQDSRVVPVYALTKGRTHTEGQDMPIAARHFLADYNLERILLLQRLRFQGAFNTIVIGDGQYLQIGSSGGMVENRSHARTTV